MQTQIVLVIFHLLLVAGLVASDHRAPRLDDVVAKKSHNVGAKLKFGCSVVEGQRPYTFEWKKDDRPVVVVMDNLMINTHDDDTELIVLKTSPADSGIYTCVTRNAYGEDFKSTLLIIKGLCQMFCFSDIVWRKVSGGDCFKL